MLTRIYGIHGTVLEQDGTVGWGSQDGSVTVVSRRIQLHSTGLYAFIIMVVEGISVRDIRSTSGVEMEKG